MLYTFITFRYPSYALIIIVLLYMTNDVTEILTFIVQSRTYYISLDFNNRKRDIVRDG